MSLALTRTKMIAICCVVASFTGLACCEWASRNCFHKSIENFKIGTSNIADLSKGFVDQRPLTTGIPIAELDHYIRGYAWRSTHFAEISDTNWTGSGGSDTPQKKWINVRWPSLISFYKVKLSIDFRDRVTQFDVMSAFDND